MEEEDTMEDKEHGDFAKGQETEEERARRGLVR